MIFYNTNIFIVDTVEMDLDLSAIGKETSTLSNDAARHRISVKRNLPKRRPSGTRKTKDAKVFQLEIYQQVSHFSLDF